MLCLRKAAASLCLLLTPLAAAVSLSLAPQAARAADVNARVKGTVTDPAGASIPNASLTATNQATGVKFTTTSQSDGGYIFQQLPVGTYTISVTASGFKSFSATGIVLNIDQEFVEPVKLEIGSASEQIEVQADAVQVNTTETQLNNIVDSTEIVELPLISRAFTGLELIEPGVQVSSDRFGSNYSVSGAQTQQSEYLINGADSNDISLNTLAIAPNLDAIEQFNLIDGPLNAEYDRNSGGIVSTTIKQGSNKFHGDGFEFYRDTFLNTLSYFQKTPASVDSTTGAATGPWTGSVNPYHQNIFGGTVGGPILHDKLFFFFGYQGTRQRTPDSASSLVYTAANLGGDFSGDLNGSTNYPISTNPIPAGITIPNGCSAGEQWDKCLTTLKGVVPTSSFNTISSTLVSKYVPAPNAGSNGYITNGVATSKADQELGRIDFSLNPRNQFSFVGIYQKNPTTSTLPFTGASLPGFGEIDNSTIQQYTFDYVRQFGSSAVNDFALHWTRFNYQAVEPQTVVDPSSLGFAINPQNGAAASVPTISVSGFFTLGFSTNGPQPRIDQVYQADETFSKTFGRHNLKFGYDGRRFNVSNPFNARNSGSYSFNTTSSTYSTGDPSLDFLLGIPGSYSQGTGADIQADAFLNYVFAQDSWKVNSTFTLNYGLGYSIDTPLRNHQYGGEGIACLTPGATSKIFPTAPAGILYPGDPGCYNSGQAQTRYSELGPRFGFAWSPDFGRITGGPGKFSVYGGYGIYYNRSEEETALQTLETPPFGLTSGGAVDYGANAPAFGNPYQDLGTGTVYANKFPFTFPTAGQAVNFTPSEPFGISTYSKGFRSPYAENFQLTVERELPSRMVTRVSYVGSLGRHNQVTYEGNAETAAGHAACVSDPTCSGANRNNQLFLYPDHSLANAAINPAFGGATIASVGTVGSSAASSYHALQASVRKGLSHGLQFQLSYTYGHALDNGSSFENSGFGENGARGYNQYDPSLNYGDSAFDARHHLVFAPIYVTPTRHGSEFSPVNLLLSGWQVSGIVTLASGFPYDISYAGGTSRSLYCSANWSFYACPDVPEQTAPLKRQDPRSRNYLQGGNSNWFDPSSFTTEPIGSFGNVHRNPYHGPGLNGTNVIVAKNFGLGAEGLRRLQIRMESDNVFNHTQFLNPVSTYGSGTFGQVNSTAPARQSQLAAKFYF